jgi:hypothetical protein
MFLKILNNEECGTKVLVYIIPFRLFTITHIDREVQRTQHILYYTPTGMQLSGPK